MEQLTFVYNANSGWHNSVLDSLHKIASPTTYNCSLCSITHGVFSENEIWKKFREKSNSEMDFLHKDEFEKQYPNYKSTTIEYPVILKEVGGVLKPLVKASEINTLKEAKNLINLLHKKTLS